MFRLVLSLISSLQIGARIKDAVERSLRQAIVIAIAVVILLFALGFGLVAAYQALVVYGCPPIAAAGILAGALALLGVLILAIVPALGKPKRQAPSLVNAPAESMAAIDQSVGKPKRQAPSLVNAPAESIAMVDQSVGKAMKQVGPLTLLVIAFAAGLLASRRR